MVATAVGMAAMAVGGMVEAAATSMATAVDTHTAAMVGAVAAHTVTADTVGHRAGMEVATAACRGTGASRHLT